MKNVHKLYRHYAALLSALGGYLVTMAIFISGIIASVISLPFSGTTAAVIFCLATALLWPATMSGIASGKGIKV